MKRYAASPQLENFILNQAPLHHPSVDAPNGYGELMQWYQDNRGYDHPNYTMPSIPVFSGGSEATIYSSNRYNFAARAWHDSIHINKRLDFSMADEIKVMNEQVRQMKQRAVQFQLSNDDYQAIKYDVGGQVLYYYKHKEYVKDQAAFVQACFDEGMIQTVAQGVRY
jgi:hypothetical protein